jgi:hypothetical protein
VTIVDIPRITAAIVVTCAQDIASPSDLHQKKYFGVENGLSGCKKTATPFEPFVDVIGQFLRFRGHLRMLPGQKSGLIPNFVLTLSMGRGITRPENQQISLAGQKNITPAM